MIDLKEQTDQALTKLHTEGKIQAIIEKQLTETISRCIDDALSSYSEFGKDLKAVLKEQLTLDPKSLHLAQYNLVIAKTIQDRMDKHLIKTGVEHMQSLIDGILVNPPAEYKLSKIIEEMIEEHQEDANEKRWERPTVIIENSSYGSQHIYLDPEEDKEKYRCKYQVSVSLDAKDKEAYGVKFDDWGDDAFERKLFVRNFSGIERILFHLYAKQSTLLVDFKEGERSFYYAGRD